MCNHEDIWKSTILLKSYFTWPLPGFFLCSNFVWFQVLVRIPESHGCNIWNGHFCTLYSWLYEFLAGSWHKICLQVKNEARKSTSLSSSNLFNITRRTFLKIFLATQRSYSRGQNFSKNRKSSKIRQKIKILISAFA